MSQRQMRRMKATTPTEVTPEPVKGASVTLLEPSMMRVIDRPSSTIGGKTIPTKRPPLVEINNGNSVDGDGDETLRGARESRNRIGGPSTIKSSTRAVGGGLPATSFLPLPLPPKFSATRWQATVPDGSGGQRRALNAFPPSRPL